MSRNRTLLLFLLISFFLSVNLLSENLKKASETNQIQHFVIEGDTLWSLSREYDVWIQDIVRINNFKKFSSGVPIVRSGTYINIPNYSVDNSYKYYCLISDTQINLDIEFNTKELFLKCSDLLNKTLDKNLLSQSIPDEVFWKTYLSDERYPVFFLNTFLRHWMELEETDLNLLNKKELSKIKKILLEGALRGDKISRVEILMLSRSEHFSQDLFIELGFSNRDEFFYEVQKNYSDDEIELLNDFYNSKTEHIKIYSKYINYDISNLPDYDKTSFFSLMIQSSFAMGDSSFYKLMQDARNYLNEKIGDGFIIEQDELNLYSILIFHHLLLGNEQIAIEISTDFDDRFQFSDTTNDYAEIWSRFHGNTFWEYEHDISNSDIIHSIIGNLIELYSRVYPDIDFIDYGTYLKITSDDYKGGYLSSMMYYQHLQEHAARLASFAKCSEADTFYRQSQTVFKEYEIDPLWTEHIEYNTSEGANEGDLSDFIPPLSIARCFYQQKNKKKTDIYLKIAQKKLNLSRPLNPVYQSSINILHILSSYSVNGFDDLALMKINQDANDLVEKKQFISSLTLPYIFKNYINDYIEFYELHNSNQSIPKSPLKILPIELIVLQEQLNGNKKLQSLKINSTKRSILRANKNLKINQEEIALVENFLNSKFDDSNFKKLSKLYDQRKKLVSRLYKNNKNLDSFLNPKVDDVLDIINSLKNNEIMFSYILGSLNSKLLIQNNQFNVIINIPYSQNYIESLVSEVRDTLEFSNEQDFNFEAASSLHDILIAPALPYLQEISSIFIYGSELEALPFGILVADYNNNAITNYQKLISAKWLIKDFSFARIFPISNTQKNTLFDNSFLGFANPDSFEDLELPKLEGAEDEIKFLALASNQDIKNLYFGESASKNRFIHLMNESFETIAFATHSLPAGWSGVSTESSLVLSGQDGDYFLTPSEIINLEIASDIVLLSSCNSEQQGMNSLYKSFLVAGSNSVIYSNWELETNSAKNITQELFSSMVFESTPKHIALQQASIAALNSYSDRQFSHPAYWGNFSIAYSNL